MEQILDRELVNEATNEVTFGAFWPRFWAALIDGILISLINIPLMLVGFKFLKSPYFQAFIPLLILFYKPVMEYKVQATIGKKLLRLKVVNSEFQRASLAAILLRYSLQLLIGMVSIVITLMFLLSVDFQTIDSFQSYSAIIDSNGTIKYVNYLPLLIGAIDAICLISDEKKRTLHDRIGNTLVITTK